MSRCLCGADDCPRCFPGNFYRGVYLDTYDERDLDEQEDAIDQAQEDAAVAAYEARLDELERQAETGRFDP